jgi:hypothetical protein
MSKTTYARIFLGVRDRVLEVTRFLLKGRGAMAPAG